MTDKPTALRLADALETELFVWDDDGSDLSEKIAAELRRLHELLKEWEAKAATWLASPEAAQRLEGYRELAQRLEKAEAQRDELLGLCQELVKAFDLLKPNWATDEPSLIREFRAVIAKAEGASHE